MRVYEYKKVYERQLQEHFDKGWEPVPRIPKIISYSLARPMEYLILRRKK